MSQACPSCGAAFEPLQGKYAPDGTIVCAPCGQRMASAAREAESKSAGSVFVGACGSLLIALMSFVVEHRAVFFLFPLVAIAGGGGTAYAALRNHAAIAALGWKRIPTILIGLVAIALALLSLIVGILARS